ncbi:hypothetical protein [Dichotomicrobium thermohalophilum]|uniref:PXPV repeat-containing protein n=1 Tax=Dichotomicrobium thermohalophilum TaxID=933063 RepID=A0A397Q2C2_9HYPH|nr:hypothetical protein [Dichotomicrobium thermohalophilum]RIA55083.1 hypothetical protein BXY53_0136 [Dichotomicrobium thermohalophilum]
MKFIACFCAALLMAAGFAGSASAATDQSQVGLLPVPYAAASANQSENIKVADSFGAGLATGIIGSIIVGGIIKHKRYHGYRHRRYYRSRHRGRCDYWSRRCANNWGYGGANYRGCLRYHGCY